jgi:hypothetical protein
MNSRLLRAACRHYPGTSSLVAEFRRARSARPSRRAWSRDWLTSVVAVPVTVRGTVRSVP